MACEAEVENIKHAFDDFAEAARDQHDAQERLSDEEGFWEEETAGTGAGVLTIAGSIIGGGLVIASGPVGWGIAIIGLGTGAGAGAIVYSESDRQDDIDAARSAVDAADRAMAKAEREWHKAMAAWCRCQAAQSATR